MDKDVKALPPPSVETRRDLIELMKVVRSYVHLVLPRWSEKDGKEIATAVMLRAGSHLFAVTAYHCVSEEMSLIFRPGEGQKARSQILRTITRKPLDIAVLELEDRPDVLACEIDQVCVDVPKPATKDSDPATEPLFWVVGFPARLAKVSKEDDLSVDQIAFGTNVIGVKPDELTLYYHEEAYGIGQDLTYANSRLPETPHGFSGSGVWGFHRAEGGKLFNPLRHVRLYGIQHAWDKTLRLLKCVPSRVVVELLMENYPDLKDRLTDLFPP
jgi:hypothetical protein